MGGGQYPPGTAFVDGVSVCPSLALTSVSRSLESCNYIACRWENIIRRTSDADVEVLDVPPLYFCFSHSFGDTLPWTSLTTTAAAGYGEVSLAIPCVLEDPVLLISKKGRRC